MLACYVATLPIFWKDQVQLGSVETTVPGEVCSLTTALSPGFVGSISEQRRDGEEHLL